jgi:hypothetical protein
MSSDSPSAAGEDCQRATSNEEETDEEGGGACLPAPDANGACQISAHKTRHDGNQLEGNGHPSTSAALGSTATTSESSLAVCSEASSGAVSAQIGAGAQGEQKLQVEAGQIDLEAASGGDGDHATHCVKGALDQDDNLPSQARAQNESENETSEHRLRPPPLTSKRTTALTSHSSMPSGSTTVEHLLAPPPHRPRMKSIRNGAHAGHHSPRGSVANAEAASANPGLQAERGSGRSDIGGGAIAGGEKVRAPVGDDHDHEPVPFAEVHAMALQLPGAVRVHPSSAIVTASAEDELSPRVGNGEGAINDNPLEVIHYRQDDEFDDATVARRESSTAIIEASLVTELALVEASPIDEEQLQTLSSQAEVKAMITRQAGKRRRLWIAIIVLATLVVILAVGISVGLTASVQEFNVPQGEVESYLRSILPNTTVTAMDDPASAQYQALQWVMDDVYLANLDLDDEEKHSRLKQRFVLAVLFYAVNSGTPWRPTVGNWLGRDSNECEWHGCTCSKEHRIQELSVRDFEVVGYIPPEIGLLDQLVLIDGGNTSIFGQLPTEITTLTRLSGLRVDQSRISGTIPAEIGRLTGLEVLYLQSSDITGTIPSELATLTNLRKLRIDNTALNGTLPTELAQLTSLTFLSIKHTIVGGTIPTQLSLLSSLEYLELHDTYIQGSVPEELCTLVRNAKLNISVSCWLVSCDCGCACGSDLVYGDDNRDTLADDGVNVDDMTDDIRIIFRRKGWRLR